MCTKRTEVHSQYLLMGVRGVYIGLDPGHARLKGTKHKVKIGENGSLVMQDNIIGLCYTV